LKPPKKVAKEEIEENTEVSTLMECSVIDMAGNATAYGISSVEELRVRVAMKAGVLAPCIVLFTPLGAKEIEDTHELSHIFDTNQQPFEISVVNKEEGVKREVANWDDAEWMRALMAHVRYGDNNIREHAAALISADDEFREKMIEWGRNLVECGNLWSYEALDYVAQCIKALCAVGCDVGIDQSDKDKGSTLLHRAAEYGHMEVFFALLGAPGHIHGVNRFGETPLYLVALRGHVDAVRALLDRGANPSHTNYDREAPLHWAAFHGHTDVASLLIEAEAEIEWTTNTGHTPLHWAARRGHTEIIRILLEAGAEVNARDGSGEASPYDLTPNEGASSSLHGHAGDFMTFVLNETYDIDWATCGGQTPLHWAAKRGHVEAIRALLKAGAEVNATDKWGRTPYEIAGDEESKWILTGPRNILRPHGG